MSLIQKIFGMGPRESVTFDANTGAVTWNRTSPDGNTKSAETMVPNDQLTDLGQYINFIKERAELGKTSSKDYPRTVRYMNIGKFEPGSKFVSVVADTEELPAVISVTMKEPATRAVVYVDTSRKSRFLYVNDPNKILELTKGGLQTQAAAVKAVALQEKVMQVRDAGNQKFQCLAETVISVTTMDQRKQIEDGMKACMAQKSAEAPATAPAPAPASGTSTYAAQGVVYPVEVGGYPAWVVILSISAIIAAILMAKKSA